MATTSSLKTIEYAQLDWQSNTPLARDFDDVYFMRDNGLDESRYVFLAGNDLPQRWQAESAFVIGEVGFGSGLNFLATWQCWQRHNTRMQMTNAWCVNNKISPSASFVVPT